MRVQRFSDAFLRSGPSPVLCFLAPSVAPSTSTAIYGELPFHIKRIQQPTTLRCLSTKTSLLNASAATATKVDENEGGARPQPDQQAKNATAKAMASIVDSIYQANAGKSQQKFSSRQVNIPSREGRTSADLFKDSRTRKLRNISDMQGSIASGLFPSEFNDIRSAKLLQVAGNSVTKARPLQPPVRLDAFVGRSEDVDPLKGVDLGKAIRKLEMKCAYNNVRQDSNKQRFHERPGLKRKRLKSERWRKRFRQGFKAVVSKVQQMRMKGW